LYKKDLSLLVLILVVGAIVAFINPRFLLVGNLSNTLNQVGLFGIFSIAEAFVIIIGGIELSVGSVIALLGVLFIDLIVNHDVNWIVALAVVVVCGLAIGVVHGTLVTRMRIQPFVVTLCGLLIYRGAARYYTQDATAGFGFGASFPTLEWLTAGRTNVLGFPLPHSVVALIVVAAVAWVVLHRSVFGRYLYAVGKNEEAARYSGIRANRVTISAYIICGGLTFDLAGRARLVLRTLRHRRGRARRLLAARRRGLDHRCRPRDRAAPGAAESRQPAGHSEFAQLCRDGDRDPDGSARGPVPRAAQSPHDGSQGTTTASNRRSAARAGKRGVTSERR